MSQPQQPGQPGQQGYAQPPAQGMGMPIAGAEPSGGMVAKIKANIPLTIGVGCFVFVILYAFIMGAFDIDDRDVRRFLGTSGLCAGASGFLALLVSAFTRATDRENSPTTVGPALLCIALLVLLASATGATLAR